MKKPKLIEVTIPKYNPDTDYWQITKCFSFEAAHKLEEYDGDCKNLHGHSYFGEITFGSSVLNEQNMVIDFKVIKRMLDNILNQYYDHKYLNYSIVHKQPTAEYIARSIYYTVKSYIESRKEFRNNVRIIKVKLHETEKSYVEYFEKYNIGDTY